MRMIVPFLAAFIIVSGCKPAVMQEQQGGQKVLATVNGVPITMDDVYLRLGGHEQAMNSPLKDKALEDIINEELLHQQGVKLNLDKDGKIQSAVRLMELRITAFKRAEMSRRVGNAEIAAKVHVSEQDVKEYHDKHAEDVSTELHLGVLQFSDPNQAKDVLARVQAGEPFEKLARERTSGRTPQMPGQKWDRGYLTWSQVPVDLLEPVYRLKAGETSNVLIGKAGIYLVKVIDRRKNKKTTYATVQTAIANRLTTIKINEAYDRYMEQVKRSATIVKY